MLMPLLSSCFFFFMMLLCVASPTIITPFIVCLVLVIFSCLFIVDKLGRFSSILGFFLTIIFYSILVYSFVLFCLELDSVLLCMEPVKEDIKGKGKVEVEYTSDTDSDTESSDKNNSSSKNKNKKDIPDAEVLSAKEAEDIRIATRRSQIDMWRKICNVPESEGWVHYEGDAPFSDAAFSLDPTDLPSPDYSLSSSSGENTPNDESQPSSSQDALNSNPSSSQDALNSNPSSSQDALNSKKDESSNQKPFELNSGGGDDSDDSDNSDNSDNSKKSKKSSYAYFWFKVAMGVVGCLTIGVIVYDGFKRFFGSKKTEMKKEEMDDQVCDPNVINNKVSSTMDQKDSLLDLYQMGLSEPVTPIMYGISSLHNHILFFMCIIAAVVIFLLFSVLYYFSFYNDLYYSVKYYAIKLWIVWRLFVEMIERRISFILITFLSIFGSRRTPYEGWLNFTCILLARKKPFLIYPLRQLFRKLFVFCIWVRNNFASYLLANDPELFEKIFTQGKGRTFLQRKWDEISFALTEWAFNAYNFSMLKYNFNNMTASVVDNSTLTGNRIAWLTYLIKNRQYRVTHNLSLEVIWTVIPTIILMIIAVPSFSLLYSMDELFDPSVTVKVVGHQWYWSYEYTDFRPVLGESFKFDSYMVPDSELAFGDLRLLKTDSPLLLPKESNIRFVISATDVLHSWAVPSFGIKMDAVPGRINQIGTFITESGRYYGQCSELCGVNHGFMPIEICVLDPVEYYNWILLKIKDNG